MDDAQVIHLGKEISNHAQSTRARELGLLMILHPEFGKRAYDAFQTRFSCNIDMMVRELDREGIFITDWIHQWLSENLTPEEYWRSLGRGLLGQEPSEFSV